MSIYDTSSLCTVYGRVECVSAQKIGPHRHCDQECKDKNHMYLHCFKPWAVLLGVPNGACLTFRNGIYIPLSPGNMLISDREY